VGGTARPSRSRSGAHQRTGNHSSQLYPSRPFSSRFDSSGVSECGVTLSGFMSATLSNSCGLGWSARRDYDRLLECFLGVAVVSDGILTFPERHRIRPPVAKPTFLLMSILALLVSPPRREHHLVPHVLSHIIEFRALSSTSPSTVSSAATLVPFFGPPGATVPRTRSPLDAGYRPRRLVPRTARVRAVLLGSAGVWTEGRRAGCGSFPSFLPHWAPSWTWSALRRAWATPRIFRASWEQQRGEGILIGSGEKCGELRLCVAFDRRPSPPKSNRLTRPPQRTAPAAPPEGAATLSSCGCSRRLPEMRYV